MVRDTRTSSIATYVFRPNATGILLSWLCEELLGKAVPLHAIKTLRGRGGTAHTHILDLGTRWGEWSASRPVRAIPPGKGTPPGTHWIGGWVGPRANLDICYRKNNFASAGDETSIVQSVVRRYTDWATPTHMWRTIPIQKSGQSRRAKSQNEGGSQSCHSGTLNRVWQELDYCLDVSRTTRGANIWLMWP
jgi:hypothetical protein